MEESVAMELKKSRLKRDLSIRKSALQIGISAMYLSKIEAGMAIPSDDVIDQICNVYSELDADRLRQLARFSQISEEDRKAIAARTIYDSTDEDFIKDIQRILDKKKDG